MSERETVCVFVGERERERERVCVLIQCAHAFLEFHDMGPLKNRPSKTRRGFRGKCIWQKKRRKLQEKGSFFDL